MSRWPTTRIQGFDDVAVDRHAADLFDLAARDRLAVGDQRQRFQRGAGVLGLALGPQPRYPGVHVGLHLVAETGGDLDQLHAAFGGLLAQGFQRFFDAVGRRRLFFGEQRVQLRQRQRLVGGQQRGFDDAGDELLIHRYEVAGSYCLVIDLKAVIPAKAGIRRLSLLLQRQHQNGCRQNGFRLAPE